MARLAASVSRNAHRPARAALLLGSALAGAALAMGAGPARAQTLPNVPNLADSGGADVSITGNRMDVDLKADNRIIDFTRYDIGAGDTVNYLSSVNAGGAALSVINRVTTNNASDIAGHITTDLSNNVGAINVWLVNPAGITFGAGASYSGGSLVLSTVDLNDTSANLRAGFALAGATPGMAMPLTFQASGPVRDLVLDSGLGAFTISGSLVLVSETITVNSPLSASGQVVLVAGSKVTFGSGLGSPLSFSIAQGTSAGGVAINRSLTGKNVIVAGSLQNALTGALLNVDQAATLTATEAGGVVSLGVSGPHNPTIVSSGTLVASGAGGSVAIVGNDAVTVEGAVNAAGNYTVSGKTVTLGKAATTVTQQAGGQIAVTATGGDITGLGTLTALSDSGGLGGGSLTLDASTGTLDLAATTTLRAGPVGQSDLRLLFDTTPDLTLGGIAANTIYANGTAGTIANGGSIVAGGAISSVASLDIRSTTGNVTLASVGVVGAGNSLAITTTDPAGDISASEQLGNTGALTVSAGHDAGLASLVAGSVSVTAGNAATVAGAVTSGADYAVTARRVILGANATAMTQQAQGQVWIKATGGDIAGRGSLVLRANSDGLGAELLKLEASNALALAGTTTLEGGPARQSAVSLLFDTSKAQALGAISALEINSNANVGGLVSSAAALTFGGKLTSTNALAITTSLGTLDLAGAEVTGSGNALQLTTTAPGGLDVTSSAALVADGNVAISAQRSVAVGDVTSVHGLIDLAAVTGSLAAGALDAGLHAKGTAAAAATTGSLTTGTYADIAGASVSVGAANVGTTLTLAASNGAVASAGGTVGNDVSITAVAALPADGTFTLSAPLALGTAAVGTGNLAVTTSGTMTLASLTTSRGQIALTSTGGDILGGAATLTASAQITLDAARDAVIGTGNAQGGAFTLGAGRDAQASGLSASTDVLVTAGRNAGLGTLTATGGKVDVKATGTALVAGAVTAATDYAVKGSAVTLGTAATTVLQQAGGAVTVTATATDAAGLGALTVQANSDAIGAELLTVAALRSAQFGSGTLLQGGPGRQSAIQLNFDTGAAQALGALSALEINSNGNLGGLVSSAAGLTFGGKVTSTNALAITTSGGSLALAGAQTTGAGAALQLTTTGAGGADVTSSGALLASGDLTISARGKIGIGNATSTGGHIDLTAMSGLLSAAALDAATSVYAHAATSGQIGAITAGTFADLRANSLIFGALDLGTSLSAVAANGSLASAGGTVGGGATISATHTIPSAGTVTINAPLTVGTTAPGTLLVSASGDIAAASLHNLAGSVSLVSTGGSVGGLAPASALDLDGTGDVAVSALLDARVGAGTATAGTFSLVAGRDAAGASLVAGADVVVDAGRDASLGALSAGDDVDIKVTGTATLASAVTTGAGADGPGEPAALIGRTIRLRIGTLGGALAGGGLVVGGLTAAAITLAADQGDIRLGSLTAQAGDITATATLGSVTGLASGYAAPSGGPSLTTAGTVIIADSGSIVLGTVSAPTITSSNVGALQIGNALVGTATLTAWTDLVLAAGTASGAVSLRTTTGTAGGFATSGMLAPGFGAASLAASAANRRIQVDALNGVAQLGVLAAGTGAGALAGDQLAVNARAMTLASGSAANGGMALRASTGGIVLGAGTARGNLVVNARTDAGVTNGAAATGSLVILAGGNVTAGSLGAGRDVAVRAGGDAALASVTAGDDIDLQAAGTLTLGSATTTAAPGSDDSFAALDPAQAGTAGGVVPGAEDAALAGSNVRLRAATLDPALSGGGGTGLIVGTGSAGSWSASAAVGDLRLGSLTATTGDIALTATLGSVTGLASAYAAPTGGAAVTTPGKFLLGISGSGALGTVSAGSVTMLGAANSLRIGSVTAGSLTLSATNTIELGRAAITGSANLATTGGPAAADGPGGFGGAGLMATAGNVAVSAAKTIALAAATASSPTGMITVASAGIDLQAQVRAGRVVTLVNSGSGGTFVGAIPGSPTPPGEQAGYVLTQAEMDRIEAPTVEVNSRGQALQLGAYAIGASTGPTALRFLGTGAVAILGLVSGSGTGALQIGGASGSAPDPLNPVDPASLAASIAGHAAAGKLIAFDQGTVDLRARRITFASNTLIGDYAAASDAQAALDVANPGSLLYLGAGLEPGLTYLSARTLQVSYADFALFQNTQATTGGGVALNQLATPQPGARALALFSTGNTGTNSFALFGSINGFVGRPAGLLPNGALEIYTVTGANRFIRVRQANSRVNGCVIGSPDKGCLIIDAPRPDLNLQDERKMQLFAQDDGDGALINPLVGRGNEGLIVGVADAPLAVPAAPECNPAEADCPAPQGAR
ncbi:filamentous hemagglutinin N-terminal domain-containing protein [Novosphingobium bradum]|uniref:Filamentous hemagglutinin N-terminal domain-containing protein n=1 Tax=Novosphingobium bradum TaxID=1737444 RepID=A0ABV7IPJ6_9SPHN